jgi:soluble epoxide hydrolase/lipid-phosphate phosphatase
VSVGLPAAAVALVALAVGGAPSAEARCVTVAPGECLQVTMSGTGPDIVLIPGLFGSAFSFRHVVPRLAEAGYRSIVIEPLGVGDSARPKGGDYSLTA